MTDVTRGPHGGRLDQAWARTWAGMSEAVTALSRAVRDGRGVAAHERSLDVQATALLLCSLPARDEVDVHRKRFAGDVLARVEAASSSCALQMADVAIWADCQALGLDPDDWRADLMVH